MVGTNKVDENNPPRKKTVLHLVYPCYICCSGHNNNNYVAYGVAARTINHVREEHGYYLPSRRKSVRRPKNDIYDYQTNMKMHWDEQQYACTSCWYHTDNLYNLIEHVKVKHTPSRYNNQEYDTHDHTNEVPFVYTGDRFEQKTVNTIFKQMNDITALFKDILKMS
ncbi:uncharacterized protein BX663DRAFT_322204 [Cokeromyces recurvatus]|uniref:uncharacterized protein n=1 Tax=Cokeromyces recurvatus TaxID=90255 RepID=UPI0022203338|nr:uncharacterized protein BX663DRAFT_322204 [Cokeromyces recurvatus]KAI7904595.1 hypothetical protein BX663DRAFT_322204 [Cokeromyces recurvatus]